MDPALAGAVIAVAGTLAGSLTTGLLARSSTRDQITAAQAAALRRNQVAAVAAVAASAADLRRTTYHRRDLEQRGAPQAELDAAKKEAHSSRSAMSDPLARVRLLLPDPAVRAAVDALVDTTFGLRDAADIEAGRRASLAAHDRLLDIAGDAIRRGGT